MEIQQSYQEKSHWENIYANTSSSKLGWFQQELTIPFLFFKELNLPLNSAIIDIGAGESRFADELLTLGYNNISVLDISVNALNFVKDRLGQLAKSVSFIQTDVLNFHPSGVYDLWHDRATFHFLTTNPEITSYVQIAANHIAPKGYLILSTFSLMGPNKCSGLPVKQYSTGMLEDAFSPYFRRVKSDQGDHITPAGGEQHYTFALFQRTEHSEFS